MTDPRYYLGSPQRYGVTAPRVTYWRKWSGYHAANRSDGADYQDSTQEDCGRFWECGRLPSRPAMPISSWVLPGKQTLRLDP